MVPGRLLGRRTRLPAGAGSARSCAGPASGCSSGGSARQSHRPAVGAHAAAAAPSRCRSQPGPPIGLRRTQAVIAAIRIARLRPSDDPHRSPAADRRGGRSADHPATSPDRSAGCGRNRPAERHRAAIARIIRRHHRAGRRTAVGINRRSADRAAVARIVGRHHRPGGGSAVELGAFGASSSSSASKSGVRRDRGDNRPDSRRADRAAAPSNRPDRAAPDSPLRLRERGSRRASRQRQHKSSECV